jgi:5'-nucleotidase
VRYGRAAQLARHAIDRILEAVDGKLEPHSVVNVNIPRTESDDAQIPPMRVVEMNTAPGTDSYERRVSPYGQAYYWAAGNGMQFTHTAPRSDVEALLECAITVTPLTFDMTDHARLRTWEERLAGSMPQR